jgi:hypothetical protein
MVGVAEAQDADAPGDWRQLKGEDLVTAFESRVLQHGDGAIQTFDSDGVTRYVPGSGWDFSGFWWVEADLMCLLWDPASQQRCFKVHQDDRGLQLRLEPEHGGKVTLRYLDEE